MPKRSRATNEALRRPRPRARRRTSRAGRSRQSTPQRRYAREDHLGVGVGREGVASPSSCAELEVVVDLAVVGDPVPVAVASSAGRPLEADDGEPPVGEADVTFGMHPGADPIRSPVRLDLVDPGQGGAERREPLEASGPELRRSRTYRAPLSIVHTPPSCARSAGWTRWRPDLRVRVRVTVFVDARTVPEGARIDADVAIVGGGAAGLTIAVELAGTGSLGRSPGERRLHAGRRDERLERGGRRRCAVPAARRVSLAVLCG